MSTAHCSEYKYSCPNTAPSQNEFYIHKPVICLTIEVQQPITTQL